ncbi:hypothetical protein TrRE_jg1503, partial [Triparma retinervis]
LFSTYEAKVEAKEAASLASYAAEAARLKSQFSVIAKATAKKAKERLAMMDSVEMERLNLVCREKLHLLFRTRRFGMRRKGGSRSAAANTLRKCHLRRHVDLSPNYPHYAKQSYLHEMWKSRMEKRVALKSKREKR